MASSKLPLSDMCQMKEHHRTILKNGRTHLIRNMIPSELLWSSMISIDLLSQNMVAKIKGCNTDDEKIGMLLDFLPQRGPEAFDKFCEVLQQCDHAFVEDYLRRLEATYEISIENQSRCLELSNQKTYELIVLEQVQELQKKDAEIQELEDKNKRLHIFVNESHTISETILAEVQRNHVSTSVLRDEAKRMNDLKSSLQHSKDFDKAVQFYANMQLLMTSLEKHFHNSMKLTGLSQEDSSQPRLLSTTSPMPVASAGSFGSSREVSAVGQTIDKKMNKMVELIIQHINEYDKQVDVKAVEVCKLMNILLKLMLSIRDNYKITHKEKKTLEGELLLSLDDDKAIQQLQKLQEENENHMRGLNKRLQLLQQKTSQKKQLEKLHQCIEQEKLNKMDINNRLSRKIESAATRRQKLYDMLPDINSSEHDCSSSLAIVDSGDNASRPVEQDTDNKNKMYTNGVAHRGYSISKHEKQHLTKPLLQQQPNQPSPLLQQQQAEPPPHQQPKQPPPLSQQQQAEPPPHQQPKQPPPLLQQQQAEPPPHQQLKQPPPLLQQQQAEPPPHQQPKQPPPLLQQQQAEPPPHQQPKLRKQQPSLQQQQHHLQQPQHQKPKHQQKKPTPHHQLQHLQQQQQTTEQPPSKQQSSQRAKKSGHSFSTSLNALRELRGSPYISNRSQVKDERMIQGEDSVASRLKRGNSNTLKTILCAEKSKLRKGSLTGRL